jgi:hypothetical protein
VEVTKSRIQVLPNPGLEAHSPKKPTSEEMNVGNKERLYSVANDGEEGAFAEPQGVERLQVQGRNNEIS